MKLAPRSKLVLIGDSITDCERARPIGEGLFGAVGKGYVSLLEGLLGAIHPDKAIRIVNMGTSGNTVLDLKARWQTDVFDLKPDWLAIMIGVNDVWRQFDLPLQREIHVSPKVYAKTLDELALKTRPKVKGLILLSPFYIEPNRADAMRARMDEYGAIVQQVAAKNDALFVDTQAAFDAVLQHMHPNAIAWDRVHPNVIGHAVIARAFLNAIGVPV
ncbi:MAG: SGNH/GDSL hydrolase family protein [Opitutaceae bacterium]|nr:SGNH/GDSL hydrolase family protein [Opitutaceae bacterium]MBP9913873.1 SGNH/GDSL hydrolase family protein [Opitutaceae bacterium]